MAFFLVPAADSAVVRHQPLQLAVLRVVLRRDLHVLPELPRLPAFSARSVTCFCAASAPESSACAASSFPRPPSSAGPPRPIGESGQCETGDHQKDNPHRCFPRFGDPRRQLTISTCPLCRFAHRRMVQGVGYRYALQHVAAHLGLTRLGSQSRDGSVEAVAQGSQQAHRRALAAWARRGRSAARVSECHSNGRRREHDRSTTVSKSARTV